MKTNTPVGPRNLSPQNSPGDFSAGIKSSDIIVAHKQKRLTADGSKQKIIVFSRVAQSEIKLDKSGETKIAAKLAVTLIKERLEKRGLNNKKIDFVMSCMYVKVEGKMQSDKNALRSSALDIIFEKGEIKHGKVRFVRDDQQVTNKPIPSAPLPTEVILPELPDID